MFHSCIKLLSSSTMDRSVLLVLLCLQAFLLITAFTSTDAAAQVTDDLQQKSPDLKGTAEKGIEKLIIRTKRSCRRRMDGCRGRPPPRDTENI